MLLARAISPALVAAIACGAPGDRARGPRACAEATTLDWVDRFVVQHQVCPFAAAARSALRVATCDGGEADAAAAFARELALLLAQPAEQPATTLLLLTGPDFSRFEDLMAAQEAAEQAAEREEARVLVLAFHPDATYGESPADAADVAMRSPTPMLHLLREADVEAAEAEWLERHGTPPNIQERNAAYLRGMGYERARALGSCPAG